MITKDAKNSPVLREKALLVRPMAVVAFISSNHLSEASGTEGKKQRWGPASCEHELCTGPTGETRSFLAAVLSLILHFSPCLFISVYFGKEESVLLFSY